MHPEKSVIISVFGSSAPRPGSAAYAQARVVGRLLAEAGYTVATGGYMGTMEAVSQGAAEAGGHVIGVTSSRIEQFRNARHNPWVMEEIKYPTLQARLMHLVTENQGMIVLPGGIGTLSEFALAWSLIQVSELTPRPLVLLGQLWQQTIDAFFTTDYVGAAYLDLIEIVTTPEAAVAAVQNGQG